MIDCFSMHEQKVQHFNILNQLRMKATSITCFQCGNWLTSHIYLHSNGQNYCKKCSCTNAERQRIHAQEDFLKDVLFPCNHLDCDYILRASQVARHVNNCKNAAFACKWCDAMLKNDSVFIEHLQTQHKGITKALTLTAPSFSLTVSEPVRDDFVIVTFHQHRFIAHVQRCESTIRVEIARCQASSAECNWFQVQYTGVDAKWTHEKRFVQCSELSARYQKGSALVSVADDAALQLDVCLYRSRAFMKMPECSICFNAFKLEVSQCANGHNVCADCGRKIAACAICRSRSKSVVKLDYLFENVEILCPHHRAGCLAVLPSGDVNAHLKACAYESVACAACANGGCYARCDAVAHFVEHHQLRENFAMLEKSEYAGSDSKTWILFKGAIFGILVETRINAQNSVQFNFKVSRLDNRDNAEGCRVEVHTACKHSDDPVAKMILRLYSFAETAIQTNYIDHPFRCVIIETND